MYVCSVYSECKYLVTIHTLNNTVIAAVINKRDEHSVKTYVTIKHNHDSVCLGNKLKLPLLFVYQCVSCGGLSSGPRFDLTP